MLSHWTQNDIDVNGVRIHYTRTGAGSGKPSLVLAHGFSDNGLCWLPVARDLEADYDVILPDAHGHGQSQCAAPGEAVDMSAELAGLVQALGLERPILGGHSMGAGTASVTAAINPGLARALVLEDPGWRLPAPEAQPGRENPFEKWMKSLAGKSVEELTEK
jgi:N-formylmaleamate deformylase